MSIKASAWAWSLSIPPTRKLVLLALANFADAQGHCWPSKRLLAQSTGLTPRTVQTVLAELQTSGLISSQKHFRADGSQSSNRYQLNLARVSDGDVASHPMSSTVPGERTAPPGEVVSPPREAEVGGGVKIELGGSSPQLSPLNRHENLEENQPPPQAPKGAAQRQEISLQFGNTLSPAQQQAARKMLEPLAGELQQQLLDELIGRNRITPVKNALGYLRALVAKASRGDYAQELSVSVREDRECRERHLEAERQREEELRRRPSQTDLSRLPPRTQAILRARTSSSAGSTTQHHEVTVETQNPGR